MPGFLARPKLHADKDCVCPADCFALSSHRAPGTQEMLGNYVLQLPYTHTDFIGSVQIL